MGGPCLDDDPKYMEFLGCCVDDYVKHTANGKYSIKKVLKYLGLPTDVYNIHLYHNILIKLLENNDVIASSKIAEITFKIIKDKD
jgi:hypothetical protein